MLRVQPWKATPLPAIDVLPLVDLGYVESLSLTVMTPLQPEIRLPHLKHLEMANAKLTRNQLEDLVSRCPQLEGFTYTVKLWGYGDEFISLLQLPPLTAKNIVSAIRGLSSKLKCLTVDTRHLCSRDMNDHDTRCRTDSLVDFDKLEFLGLSAWDLMFREDLDTLITSPYNGSTFGTYDDGAHGISEQEMQLLFVGRMPRSLKVFKVHGGIGRYTKMISALRRLASSVDKYFSELTKLIVTDCSVYTYLRDTYETSKVILEKTCEANHEMHIGDCEDNDDDGRVDYHWDQNF